VRKVVIIGSGGSGKSTFARQLGEITGLPVVHLDKLFWHPGWKRTPEDEWREIVRRETEKPEWIMDGNFGGTREMRMQAADTIILLDLPRWLCMYRILKRTLLYKPGARPDMAEGCDERFDPEFLLWVWNYGNDSRKRALAEIEQFADKTVVILQTRSAVTAYLNSLRAKK
jgi:adenylate kinase family enzyme